MITGISIADIHKDFDLFIKEIGVTHAQLAEVADTCRPNPSPNNLIALYLKASPIEGVGLFVSMELYGHTHLGPFVSPDSKFLFLGRYVNHSPAPNAYVVVDPDGGASLWTASDMVNRGEEITVDYRQVRDTLFMNHSNLEGASVNGESRSVI